MRERMKGVLLASCLVVLVAGCDGEPAEEDAAADAEDTMAETEGATGAGGDLAIEDVQGTWTLTAFSQEGDSLVSYRLDATGDPSGWTVMFPDTEPVQVRNATLAGDSLTMELGPYSSALREGVQVTTYTVGRVQGDRMMGHFTARYQTTGADSVLQGRFEGSRQN